MIVTIPAKTVVFRRLHDNGRAGDWHILLYSCDNFGRNQILSHQDKPAWLTSKTHISVCGKREDDRITAYGFIFDGQVEFSTIGNIKDVCRKCHPYLKLIDRLSSHAIKK